MDVFFSAGSERDGRRKEGKRRKALISTIFPFDS